MELELQLNVYKATDKIYVLAITGRLDAFTVEKLREEQTRLLEEGVNRFVVNLSQTTFIDSAGMSAMVSLLKRSRLSSGNVVLVKPTNQAAYRILTLTRFDQVFAMADDITTAVAYF